MSIALELADVAKSFVMHLQGGVRLSVVSGVTFSVRPGECIVLSGPSGAGKSSVLKMIFGSYRCERGRILVAQRESYVDVARATPRQILALRRRTIGYVSQFLRVVPRVPTLDVVAEPLRRLGIPADAARDRAGDLLEQLAIPERLWLLPPQTFSGGEQQRVNIARGLAVRFPVMLLDEPTSALDAENRARVAAAIGDAKRRGAAIIGIFHDQDFAAAVGTRRFDVVPVTEAA